MRIYDKLYGQFGLPDYIDEIAQTDLCIRSRKLTQDSAPNSLLVKGPAPSRFEHGLGVAHLLDIITTKNPNLKEHKREVITAGLLHDAGNPPCSHLFEDLLEAQSGHRGESHLEEMMVGSGTKQVLNDMGIDSSLIIKLVTGQQKPLSDGVSGSMDSDNLDNIARYKKDILGKDSAYKPEIVAAGLRFEEEGWYGTQELIQHTVAWRNDRKIVYEWIYGPEHTVTLKMIYRAAEIAFTKNLLPQDFFKLTDEQSVEFLSRCGDPDAEHIINSAIKWRWYKPAVIYTSDKAPNTKLLNTATNWKSKKQLADHLAQELKLKMGELCIHIGMGRDDRQVTLPIKKNDVEIWRDQIPAQNFFRFSVWTDPDINMDQNTTKKKINKIVGIV